MARRNGIPLAEILFAVLVVGLLAAVAIPPIVYSSDARTAECKANVQLLSAAVEHYAAQHHGRTPASQKEFERILAAEKEWPSGRLPKCPYGRPYRYDPATGRVVGHQH